MFKNLIIISIISILFIACSNSSKEEEWTAFIYPDKNNTKRSLKSPITFKSLKKCEEISKKQLKNQKLESFAILKCGLNCKFHKGMKIEICEKMISFHNEKTN